MESTARRLYFTLAIAVFVIALPVLYGFIAGVRIRPGLRLVPTGTLVIESKPSGAQVFVEERMLGKTPLRVPSLSPGRFTVRLEKDAYTPWSKELTIEAGRATLALSVPLYRTHPTVTVLDNAPKQWSLDPTGTWLLEATENRLQLRSLANNTLEALGDSVRWDSVVWAPDGRRALVRRGNVAELLTIGIPSRVTLLPLRIADASFDPMDRDAVLVITERGLEQFGTTSLVRTVILPGTIQAYAAAGSELLWRSGAGALRWGQRGPTGRIAREGSVSFDGTEPTPLSADGELLLSSDTGLYRLVAGKALALLPRGPYRVVPHPSGEWIAVASSTELWAVLPAKRTAVLLHRGEIAGDPVWLHDPLVVLFPSGGISAVDFDERGKQNNVRVYRNPGTTLVGTDAKDQVLLLARTPDATEPQLISLTIR